MFKNKTLELGHHVQPQSTQQWKMEISVSTIGRGTTSFTIPSMDQQLVEPTENAGLHLTGGANDLIHLWNLITMYCLLITKIIRLYMDAQTSHLENKRMHGSWQGHQPSILKNLKNTKTCLKPNTHLLTKLIWKYLSKNHLIKRGASSTIQIKINILKKNGIFKYNLSRWPYWQF